MRRVNAKAEQHADEEESEEETKVKNHPKEDCSASLANRGSAAADDDPNRPLTDDELATCVAQYWAGEMAKRESQRPVQPDGPGGVQAKLPKEKKTRRKAFLRGENTLQDTPRGTAVNHHGAKSVRGALPGISRREKGLGRGGDRARCRTPRRCAAWRGHHAERDEYFGVTIFPAKSDWAALFQDFSICFPAGGRLS